MADDKKIFVDDDWKAQARAEKEKLSEQTAKHSAEGMPAASFVELINLLVMQAMAGMGMLAGAGGQPIPPNLELAKHYIDMLQMLEDKTKNNLNAEEKKLLDQVLYEMRMTFVQRTGGGRMG